MPDGIVPPVPPVPPIATDELAALRAADGQFDTEKVKKIVESEKFNRQQISKLRQVPSKVEEYGENYNFDSKYTEFNSVEENKALINDLFGKLDKVSIEKGIGVERNHDLRNFMLDVLTEKGVIDLESAAAKEVKKAEQLANRNKVLQEHVGDTTDLNAWEESLTGWLKDFCNSEAEFNAHLEIIKTNPNWALSLNKVKHAMMGNRIPVIQSDPKFNQEEWDRNFVKADKDTQDRMLKERADVMGKKI